MRSLCHLTEARATPNCQQPFCWIAARFVTIARTANPPPRTRQTAGTRLASHGVEPRWFLAALRSTLRQSAGMAILASVCLVAETAVLADEVTALAAAWLGTLRADGTRYE